MKKIIVKSLLVSLSFGMFGAQTFACSCISPESPEISLEKATGVFMGTVQGVNEKKGKLFSDMREKEVKFQVSDVVKGEYNRYQTIHTESSSASCGYNFEIGTKYIVYTYGEPENQRVSLCSRTNIFENASEDLYAFQDKIISYDDEGVDNRIENEKSSKNILFFVIGIFVSVLGIGIFWRKKGKK